jgi:predicted O-methyltransferase YrrM
MPLDASVLELLLPIEPETALEIGCFRGQGTLMLAKYFSNITCVDPWDDEYVKERPGFSFAPSSQWVGQYEKFSANTASIAEKLTICRGKSKDVLPTMPSESFDFIFVDGDHSHDAVAIDAAESFRLVKNGGIILFDDYTWVRENTGPKTAIDEFCKQHADDVVVVFKTNQYVAVRKVVN